MSHVWIHSNRVHKGCGGRIPTNEEKDADALQQVAAAFGSAPEMKADSANPGPQLIAGEASGSGLMKPESMAADLAASFEPSAAAGAINAVIVPPTSAAGLEDGVEHMEVDKKSDDDWLIADPVPLTETEMVGTFLQDQEKKDREQYVFLTQEVANMETVKDTPSELTEHIHRLSVGDFQADVAGPQTDGPKRVEVEPAGDGFFRLTCFPEPFPHVSRYVSSLLGGLSVQEVAQLFDVFRGKPLTRAGVERALECYIIVKRAKEHGKLLARKFLKPSDKRGIGYGGMKEAYDAREMMCPTCLTPRDPEKKKCLFCKSTEDAVHCTQPMASMMVDGKLWELRFEADGTYHWEAEGVTQEEKDAAMVDISALAQSPSPSMDPKEASFADQVPQSLRIKLRDQVVTNAPDPALVEALAKRNERPHIKQEEDQNEGQKVFHPGAAKAMKLRQATLCDPIEPPKVDLAKVEEAVTLTTEVLGEMQTGALSVADKEALGAKVLRQLDMEHYKECLKRSYLDGPGASILQAQTSIEKAREQNLAMQARGQKMAADLHLIPEPRSFWTDRARSAFEQNVFAPEFEMDDAMAIDHEAVITEYKEMKGFLQSSNTRQFAPKLYSELPETPVKELDLDGTMVGPTHPAFKLALLTRMCNHHFGELRQFGGVWRLAYGRFNPPKWAKQLKRQELTALETRTHPADLRNWNFTPCLYTEEDVKKQVEAGLRPAPEKIRGGFWAPYDEERYWQRQTQTWTLPALFHVYGNSWTMKELYGIWCEMPFIIQRSRRGQGETAKEHQANLQKTKDEVQQFLDANNLGRLQSPAEWRQCYRELGKFLAMRAFLTNTPQVVMEIPVAPITDDREHMIMRAICDERISLPLDAFKEHPEIYDQIVAILPADQLMDVKVAWRCNTTQYAKLGYSAAAIEAMDLNPFGGQVNLTAQGAKLLGEEPAHSGHPNPGSTAERPFPCSFHHH